MTENQEQATHSAAQDTDVQAQSLENSEQSELSGNPGLLDGVTGIEKETPQEEAAAQETIQEWYWADGVKAEGERPDWLKERYKNVSEQAKAYNELEKKFGEFKGAPKDGYNFDNIEGIDYESPILKHFSETFKELNLTQQGFDRVVNEFVQAQSKAIEQNAEKELAKLGPQAKSMVQETVRWINNNLSKESAQVVNNWILSADDYNALKELQSLVPVRNNAPTSEQMSYGAHYETKKELYAEKTQNWARYNSDENYRNSLDQRLERAIIREKKSR